MGGTMPPSDVPLPFFKGAINAAFSRASADDLRLMGAPFFLLKSAAFPFDPSAEFPPPLFLLPNLGNLGRSDEGVKPGDLAASPELLYAPGREPLRRLTPAIPADMTLLGSPPGSVGRFDALRDMGGLPGSSPLPPPEILRTAEPPFARVGDVPVPPGVPGNPCEVDSTAGLIRNLPVDGVVPGVPAPIIIGASKGEIGCCC